MSSEYLCIHAGIRACLDVRTINLDFSYSGDPGETTGNKSRDEVKPQVNYATHAPLLSAALHKKIRQIPSSPAGMRGAFARGEKVLYLCRKFDVAGRKLSRDDL